MEEGYFPAKTKRKDLDEVNDDFSGFSLSSPARKIRRLDAVLLPPIIEEEEKANPVVFGQSAPPQQAFSEQLAGSSPIAIEELSGGVPQNEERAIVLFDPMNNTPWLRHGSPRTISFDSDFLSAYKNKVPESVWSNRPDILKSLEGETEKQGQRTGCLAVVPWVPNHFQQHHHHMPPVPQPEVPEMMDADGAEPTTMEVEDAESQPMPRTELGSMGASQWQQQHCMVPQPPHNLSTPVTWLGRGA